MTQAGSHPRPKRRVAFLNTHPIQYAAPLYAFIAQSDDIEPVALYLTDFSLRGDHDQQFARKVVWDIDLLAGYEHHFVGPTWQSDRPFGFWALKGQGLWQAIGQGGFDALVLHGHNHLANLVALAACRAHGVPVLYKAETHLLLPRGKGKAALRPVMLKSLFSQVAGFLAVSARNRQFYRSLGIAANRISDYPYTVDNARLVPASSLSGEERADLRRELGLSADKPVIVYASKFMTRKHPDDLIRAASMLALEGLSFELLFVGTGEMEGELRRLAAQEPRLTTVFAGFKNQTELPRVLGASDVFVLPSENEPFGLIVNEAMCAGLPVIVSEEVGCVPDLVKPGETGFTFDAGDVAGLADRLRTVLSDSTLRDKLGGGARARIGEWNYAANLRGLRAALARF